MNGPTFAQTMPAPATRPAPPRPAVPARPTAKPEPDGGGGRVLTYLRLHWLTILFCGTLLGGVASYAAWELLASKYESYALLQVSSVPSSLATGGNREQARTDFVTYLKTTSALIKSEFVLNAALRDIKDVPTIKEQKEPIKFLDEEVQVNWQDGSEVVRITFKGQNPGDSKKIVDSVQQAFLKEVVEKDILLKKKFKQAVEEERDAMQRILEQKSKKGEKPAVAAAPGAAVPPTPGAPPLPMPGVPPVVAGPVAPPLPNGREALYKLDPKILTTKLVGLYTQLDALPLEINEAKKELIVAEGKFKALQEAPIDPETTAAVENDREVVYAKGRVAAARRQYVFYSSNGDPNAPRVRELKAELDAGEAALARIREAKVKLLEGHVRVAEAKKLAAEWEAAKKKLDRLEEQLKQTRESLARDVKQLFELPQPGDKAFDPLRLDPATRDLYDAQRTDLLTTDSIFSRLVQQYYMTDLELKSPPRVRILQPASTPTQKDLRKQILGTVFAGLMGYALIALGLIAFETVGRRVSSLADLKSAGPAPVVGVIPCLPNEAMGRDPAKRVAANEAIDKLRSYVAQSWLSRGATTVAVTSPLGDEGKAFVAFGLASSLAQAGYRTLLVDFDLRDPALHSYAGVANQNGVCEILRGEADPRTVVQTLPSGLHLIPAGKWSDEARQAAVGGKLEVLLNRLRDPFDCIVLHGHALLTVAESVEIARRCEVVLVCAQYRETKVPLLRKATDRLAAMEVPYSGVVYVGASEQEALC